MGGAGRMEGSGMSVGQRRGGRVPEVCVCVEVAGMSGGVAGWLSVLPGGFDEADLAPTG